MSCFFFSAMVLYERAHYVFHAGLYEFTTSEKEYGVMKAWDDWRVFP